jgi:hypothetical protein
VNAISFIFFNLSSVPKYENAFVGSSFAAVLIGNFITLYFLEIFLEIISCSMATQLLKYALN